VNYLAHLYLVNDTPGLIIGSILGDFIKGSLKDGYSPEIRKGIELHRTIDSYTDSHAIVHQSKRMISPHRRRFAGIMVDLFYDHFLAKNWSHYSSIALNDFSQHVYAILIDHQDILPNSFRTMLPYMVEQNWLTSYQEINQIDRALNGISRRLKCQNSLFNSAEELEWHYVSLENYFQAFFPDLVQFVESLL